MQDGSKLCRCGHTLDDHHCWWIRGGGMFADECEFYGFNETGGMQYVDGRWVDHCQRFRPIPWEVSADGTTELGSPD